MARIAKLAASLLTFSSLPRFVAAESRFLAPSRFSEQDVEAELLAELKDSFRQSAHSGRVAELEEVLRPMFSVLPRDQDGNLPHSVVRYALHRLFAQKGWFLKGVEPDGTLANESSMHNLKEWVPSVLQRFIEKSMNGKGLGIHEVAVMAMALEDFVQREAVGRLETLYTIHGMAKDQAITLELADKLLESFAVIYHKGGDWSADTSAEVWRRTRTFEAAHAMWPRLTEWLRQTRSEVTKKDSNESMIEFSELSRVVEEIGNRFGPYNDQDCSTMKAALVEMEDKMPGRVLLSEFYAKAIHKKWAFTEKKEYLRTLGALDETDPDKPRVLVANYVASRPQCLEASGFYAICCANECEPIIGQLEKEIGESSALPAVILESVSKMSSSTVQAPRQLPENLVSRLHWVANHHGGRVPLHGRLFAQWLHNAFPRECPFPHQAGTASAQTPDEWMQSSGQKSISATEEEMSCHVDGPCAGGAASKGTDEKAEDASAIEIPWSDAEELLVEANPYAGPSATLADKVGVVNRVLRMLAMYGAALGVATWNKLPIVDLTDPKKLEDPEVAATIVLFCLPLTILCVDFFFEAMSFSGELLLCLGSFGAAAMFLMKMKGGAIAIKSPCFSSYNEKCFV
eukprot:TRINITY_DN10305_c0_g1_i1.p1 TRINITY_DN10305_c0_g1~~TRINITY_DN10305_c0_g1_i1.p1  ORF type:complete len:661 (+),score=165.66 TRINITY_DN10305_c0_g1_i1:98-1984(+)